MAEKKNRNKGLIVIIVVLVLLVLGLGGYFVYANVFKDASNVEQEPEEILDVSNFYSISELVKNEYIRKIEDTVIRNSYDDVIFEIRNDKLYIVEDIFAVDYKLVEAKGVQGIPKYIYYYISSTSDVFVTLTEEGDVYYGEFDSDSHDGVLFSKVNTDKVLNIYVDVTEELENNYPFKNDTIYLELENGELISLVKGKLGKTYKELWPYPDQVCGRYSVYYVCDRVLMISSDRYLYNAFYTKNSVYDELDTWNYEPIKYKGKKIKVKDAFVVSKEFPAYDFEEDDANLKYINSVFYVIGEDNYIYVVEKKAKNSGKISKIKLHSDQKILDYEYVGQEYGVDNFEPEQVNITYENGKSETIKDLYEVSTLYERYNK